MLALQLLVCLGVVGRATVFCLWHCILYSKSFPPAPPFPLLAQFARLTKKKREIHSLPPSPPNIQPNLILIWPTRPKLPPPTAPKPHRCPFTDATAATAATAANPSTATAAGPTVTTAATSVALLVAPPPQLHPPGGEGDLRPPPRKPSSPPPSPLRHAARTSTTPAVLFPPKISRHAR